MYLYSANFNYKFLNSIVIVLTLIITGCSFSDSSGSLSDSSGSISDSASSVISSPSSNSDKEKKYINEVSDYTMAYVKSTHEEADYNSFLKGLSDIATKSGIANWDQNPKTYIAIGKGLKKAGIEGVAYETYRKNLGNSDFENMGNIQKGYESK